MIFTETYFTFFKAIPSELAIIEAGAYIWDLRLKGFLKVSALYASERSVVSNSCILNEMAKRRKLGHCGLVGIYQKDSSFQIRGRNHLFMPFHSLITALSKSYTRNIFYP